MLRYLLFFFIILWISTHTSSAQSNGFTLGYDHNNNQSSLLSLEDYGHWNASFRYNIMYKGVKIPLRLRIAKPYNLLNKDFNGVDYLLLPSNHFSINPTYKGVKLFLGHNRIRFSKHGNMFKSLLGVGIRLAANGGSLEFHKGKIYNNVNRGLTGERTYLPSDVMAGRIAFETKDKFGLFIHFIKSKEDKAAYESHSLRHGETSMVGSELYVKIFKVVKLFTEGSISSHNEVNNEDWIEGKLLGLVPIQLNTQTGYRLSGGASIKVGMFDISTNSDYISPLYQSVGNPFQVSDIIDHTINVGFSLWKNKLHFNNTIGQRSNNLSNTKLGSNKSLLLSSTASLQLHQNFSITGMYNNFDSKEVYELDTFSVGMITKTLSIIPKFSFKALGLRHMILLNWMSNDALFSGAESIVPTNVEVNSYGLSYVLRLNKMNFRLRYANIDRSIGDVKTKTNISSLGVQIPLWKEKLKTNLRLQYYDSSLNRVMRYRIGFNIKILKGLEFEIGTSLQDYIKQNPDNRATNRAIITTQLNSRF